MAFANLYADFGCAVMACQLGLPYEQFYEALPTTSDGVVTMSLIEAAVASNANDGHWQAVLPASSADRM